MKKTSMTRPSFHTKDSETHLSMPLKCIIKNLKSHKNSIIIEDIVKKFNSLLQILVLI